MMLYHYECDGGDTKGNQKALKVVHVVLLDGAGTSLLFLSSSI